ncbi:hypothetical protein [Jatrophihabitans lederbergiae]|jgi:hypothetical protein|uniref:ABC transporter permease n=1 Tax=Jatrophihabitans lederbergiae TaxID=3075547 RepID=A0ABU2JB90_9ACTN|nr:hypothetical protein [Jatrophihabitans sp. DSM 44399]MDT0262222.1 hypothetical protein [Jatrophihabitans sp. DSM 44399]
MYVWIWRHLPGATGLRLLQALVLVALVSALLLFVVFPYIEPRLPANPITGPGTVNQ